MMKKMILLSLVTATTLAFGSTQSDIDDLQKQIDRLKKKVSKNNAQSANDNIKWSVDLRTSLDNINYDMANGTTKGNDNLMSMRLWLNMAYAPDSKNIFKGQLSYNKAFGADFGTTSSMMPRGYGMDTFDWVTNEALTGNSIGLRYAYWLYMGDDLFGQGVDWTFSVGRRPSVNGFLASLAQDDKHSSPLGHIINVEFDGASAKIDLSKWTGIDGMSFKICAGQGSTNAEPLFSTTSTYAEDTDALDGVSLVGFIFVPYDDGQFIVETNYFQAFSLPGMDIDMESGEQLGFKQYGDMEGAALSVLVDGLTEDGILSETKLFGSFAWSNTMPDDGQAMLGSLDDESGTSYWFGAYIPIGEDAKYGTIGAEYNHGSEYWRPFTYAEDTMIGSKLAARGDAFEINYTYQLTKALSLQARYVSIDYDYTGSNGFFGNTSGASMKIDDVKAGANAWSAMGGTQDPASAKAVVGNLMAGGMSQAEAEAQARGMGRAASFLPNIVESSQDFRFYLRYRF